jgi:hypothetical protein
MKQVDIWRDEETNTASSTCVHFMQIALWTRVRKLGPCLLEFNGNNLTFKNVRWTGERIRKYHLINKNITEFRTHVFHKIFVLGEHEHKTETHFFTRWNFLLCIYCVGCHVFTKPTFILTSKRYNVASWLCRPICWEFITPLRISFNQLSFLIFLGNLHSEQNRTHTHTHTHTKHDIQYPC